MASSALLARLRKLEVRDGGVVVIPSFAALYWPKEVPVPDYLPMVRMAPQRALPFTALYPQIEQEIHLLEQALLAKRNDEKA